MNVAQLLPVAVVTPIAGAVLAPLVTRVSRYAGLALATAASASSR